MIITNKQINILRLDELLAGGRAMTREEIMDEIPEIDRRVFFNYIGELERDFNAPIEKGWIGKEATYRYKDPEFSIKQQFIEKLNLDIKTVQDALQALAVMEGDDTNNTLVWLYLMGIKNDLLNEHRPFMAFDNNLDLKGIGYLKELGKAILNKQPQWLHYKPYTEELQRLVIHPYFLKQYKGRWFLLAWSETAHRIHNFALDRIEHVEDAKLVTYLPQPNNVRFDEYFDDIVGVTNYDDREVETVVLRVSRKSYDYIATKPLHMSQRELKDRATEDSAYFSIKVKTNYELEMLLLSYGDAIEVIEPLSLRETMRTTARNMAALYND